MNEYGEWLAKAVLVPEAASNAHFRLVAIHPFADGNGRTAWLLMNLLLLRFPARRSKTVLDIHAPATGHDIG
jgi:Fic family protein